jgi:hypothetical protein
MKLVLTIDSSDDAIKGIATLTKYLQDGLRAQAAVNVSLVEQNTKLIYINQSLREEVFQHEKPAT